MEVQQTGPDSEEAIEMSGHGRRKRAPRHIGALNGCLCGMVINPNVDLSAAIECNTVSNLDVKLMGMFYSSALLR